MIDRDEIRQKSDEFGIHTAHVQRDYVFGWLLFGIYSASRLGDTLVLKGGNCFRKAYFPNTRFSADLDFSTQGAVDEVFVRDELNGICRLVQERTGVSFDTDRTRIEVQNEIDNQRRVFDVRLYFNDFYGNADHIWLRVSIDITEFDRIYLPVQARNLIHPYSDAQECAGPVRCLKLEEMLANKLKCLLQRRHVPDVFDLVFSIFVNRDLEVNRSEILSTFFRKTIYQPSPGVARQLLLELPLAALKTAWTRYIVVPVQTVLNFDAALEQFQVIINELFAAYPSGGRAALAYFPSRIRSPLMEAASDRRLVQLTYDGVRRVVEPYALVFKRRQDGHGEEYLYVFDRTGGRTSGPGIKSMINRKVQDIAVLDDKFEPRYPIELGRAGEFAGRGYFAGSPGRRQWAATRIRTLRHGWRYTVQCPYCNREFRRMRRDASLKPHKDSYGNACYGRHGSIIGQEFV
jgi:predicted nucleotidyltransferase component of viral defense system